MRRGGGEDGPGAENAPTRGARSGAAPWRRADGAGEGGGGTAKEEQTAIGTGRQVDGQTGQQMDGQTDGRAGGARRDGRTEGHSPGLTAAVPTSVQQPPPGAEPCDPIPRRGSIHLAAPPGGPPHTPSHPSWAPLLPTGQPHRAPLTHTAPQVGVYCSFFPLLLFPYTMMCRWALTIFSTWRMTFPIWFPTIT